MGGCAHEVASICDGLSTSLGQMLRAASYRLIRHGLNLKSPSLPQRLFKTNHHHHPTRRAMATTTANLAAERFLADREPPYCSLNATKSWGQLTYVSTCRSIIFTTHIFDKVPRSRSTPTTSDRHPGRVLVSFRANGPPRRRVYTTCSFSHLARMASLVT